MAFQVENLTFKYPGAKAPCLKDLTCCIESGKFTAILGPNGSGKTSLLKLLLGINKPTTGSISFNDRPIGDYRDRERARLIAYLPQNSLARHQITVREFILMGRYPWSQRFGGADKTDLAALDRAIELTRLGPLVNRIYASLSGGERQRCLLARALCQDTSWLLLDEASANLDLAYQVEIFELLKKLQKTEGVSVLAILHDINLAMHHADDALLLKEGKLFASMEAANFNPDLLGQLYGLKLECLKSREGRRHLVW
ncbi:MAG: ABC transporter ATP-binding protein [Eubacteriales bacterium]|nr:ABC transporter ATP-binding protein [Eubacteriales bacterium]